MCNVPNKDKRRNFSLVARYSLKFTRCLLVVAEVACCKKSLVTRCKIRSLLLQNSLVTRCRSCSLQKITRYSLQDFLLTRCRSCSLQKITHYSLQNLLVIHCKSCSLLVAEIARCKKSLATHCTANFDRYLLCKVANKNQFQLN